MIYMTRGEHDITHMICVIQYAFVVVWKICIWRCSCSNNNNWTDMRWFTWLTEMNRHDMIYMDDRDKQMAWFAWLTEINGHNMINMIDSDDKWTWDYAYEIYEWLCSIVVICEHIWWRFYSLSCGSHLANSTLPGHK